MKATPLYIALIASVVFAAPGFAQDKSTETTTKTAVEATAKPERMQREPMDLAKFSATEQLKAADTDGDGFLSRTEIEAHALKMMVKRAADRMERRLDVNKDGKISLEAVAKQRAETFAKLDTNKDGKLERSELKAAKQHRHAHQDGKHHGKHAKGEHKKHSEHKSEHNKADKSQSN